MCYCAVMSKPDKRSLPATMQQALRSQAIALVREGMPQTQVMRVLGISRSALAKWLRLWRTEGEDALSPKRRGRPLGTGTLSDAAVRSTHDALCNHVPEEFGLSSRLWSIHAVRDLLMISKDLPPVTPVTVSSWMRQWGFQGPEPGAKAMDGYDDAISESTLWYLQEYPEIRRQARKDKSRILLFDEKTLSDACGDKRSPRFVLCAVDGRGTLYFMVAHYPVTAAKRIGFMERLILEIQRPIVLLLNSHPNHKNGPIHKWQRERADSISLVHIPIFNLRYLPRECWPFRNTEQ